MIFRTDFLRLCAVLSKVTELAAVIAGFRDAQKVFHICEHYLKESSLREGKSTDSHRLAN